MPAIPSPSQFITLSASGVGTVRALMGEAAPKLSAGDPRWETVQRPRRPSLTLWRGRDPYQMAISLLLDADGESIERDLNNLDRMKRSPANGRQPPLVRVSGAVPRRDIKNWVISSIVYGDNVIMDVVGGVAVRTRQDVTVTLLERIDEDRVERARPVKKGGPKHAFHLVKKGETLASISQYEYGDVKHVAAIRKANNLMDSRKLPARLRMP